jgi:hypothetical protein
MKTHRKTSYRTLKEKEEEGLEKQEKLAKVEVTKHNQKRVKPCHPKAFLNCIVACSASSGKH